MNRIATALLLAAATLSTTAFAAPIALDGSLSNGMLDQGHYKAVFTNNTAPPEKYTFNSLSYSFSFKDDGEVMKLVSTSDRKEGAYGSVKHGESHRDVTVATTNTYTGEQESVALWFGNFLLGSGSTQLVHSSETSAPSFQEIYDGKKCTVWFIACFASHDQYSNTTTTTTTVKNAYTGEFTISGTVTNQSIIDALLNDGQMTFKLKVLGDLMLTNSQFLLDYTKVEDQVEQPGEVPEPSSVLLAGAGLAAIGFLRRRRSAAQA
ncbi:PEP-CTERM sorting domain-containing protein [Massilia arenae]|uniref:PEP-CTERM sorting domain-containing protein n=1 Tax=Massilia arenae TaxID=2603288 RepID=A0A5C7FR08_9BURK|nr:PEP-CTERM sorting domain-containing protein [Massilia arenae]TXF97309.1 PEP-CTERM sorting domain-containing protein [Massilia arenae]